MKSSQPTRHINDVISMWVIYDHPTDYPDGVIARLWYIAAGSCTPSAEVIVGTSLEEVRDRLPPGLSLVPRVAEDDPKIAETWV